MPDEQENGVGGLEVSILGQRRISLATCRELAERLRGDGFTFDICGPKGSLKAKWADVFMGIFSVAGKKGFFLVDQFATTMGMWCCNLQAPQTPQTPQTSCKAQHQVSSPKSKQRAAKKSKNQRK